MKTLSRAIALLILVNASTAFCGNLEYKICRWLESGKLIGEIRNHEGRRILKYRVPVSIDVFKSLDSLSPQSIRVLDSAHSDIKISSTTNQFKFFAADDREDLTSALVSHFESEGDDCDALMALARGGDQKVLAAFKILGWVRNARMNSKGIPLRIQDEIRY